jgi:hypothetical protein
VPFDGSGATKEGDTYEFPTGSQDWAGFANDNTALYPFEFAEAGVINFTASSDQPVNLKFVFEFNPYPDVDPNFESSTVTVDGACQEYQATIPAQSAGQTFSSFLMYIVENDIPVTVNDVVVNGDTVPCGDSGETEDPVEPVVPNDPTITPLNITETSAAAGFEFKGLSCVASTEAPVASETLPVVITETVILVPEQAGNTQHVYVSDSQLSEDGSQVTVTLSYKSDEPNTTGVGFTVNFDSGILSMNAVSEVFSGAIASGSLNADGNALDFGWASLFGQFPGSNEADLAKITFDIDPGATAYAQLDLVATSNAAGFEFDVQSQQITVVNVGDDSSVESSDDSSSVTDTCTIASPEVGVQSVYILESTSVVSDTDPAMAVKTVKLGYASGSENTTGIGFRLHFNSEVLTVGEITNVFPEAIAAGDTNDDTADDDDDSQTDKYLTFGWASLFGQFPGSQTAELATITFTHQLIEASTEQ